MSTDRTIPTDLLGVVGKALYGWDDDEPNEATGYTTVYEATKVAAAIHEAGYRDTSDLPGKIDVSRLADAIHQVGYGGRHDAPTHDALLSCPCLTYAERLVAAYIGLSA